MARAFAGALIIQLKMLFFLMCSVYRTGIHFDDDDDVVHFGVHIQMRIP